VALSLHDPGEDLDLVQRVDAPHVLLDLADPRHVIGRLAEPLLSANENERVGYVPNVVYSCGGLVHEGLLVIPYSMSDYATSFATVPLADVLAALTAA
jgi:predicted GH43/DUF377 family glycosyl hydrolase